MSELTLKVETGVGARLEQTAHEIITLAKRLDICVTTKFNGLVLIATPKSSIDDIVKRYDTGFILLRKRKNT